MQQELARIWREEEVTMILVTHDLEEAIYLADRVLVLARERGARPKLIDVTLPRPRDRNEAAFVEMRRRLMHQFGFRRGRASIGRKAIRAPRAPNRE